MGMLPPNLLFVGFSFAIPKAMGLIKKLGWGSSRQGYGISKINSGFLTGVHKCVLLGLPALGMSLMGGEGDDWGSCGTG